VRRHLKRLVREFQPDIIHVHGMRALESTKGLGIPVVFTNHTSGFLLRIASGRKQFPSLAWRMKHLALLLAPSVELLEAARTAGFHGSGAYIPNGVDTIKFQPHVNAELRAKYGIAQDDFVAILARRLVEKNGVVVPLIVGDGVEREAMEKVFANSKASPIFVGSQPNDAMPGFYHASNVAVLPSYMEATSVTGLEAMACGLPLVGTRVGGIPDLIDEGKNGYLVEPRQPSTIASCLLKMKANLDETREMGKQSRRKVEEHFSWDSIARLTLDEIKRTIPSSL
jgi:glycosyltransferase involved in cell wall biosynthesis